MLRDGTSEIDLDAWLVAHGEPVMRGRDTPLPGPVPMTRCTVVGLAAAWCNGTRGAGVVPATLVAAQGTEEHFISTRPRHPDRGPPAAGQPVSSGEPCAVFTYGTLMPGRSRWPALAPYALGTGESDSVHGVLLDTGYGYPALVNLGSDSLTHEVVVCTAGCRSPRSAERPSGRTSSCADGPT